MKRLSLIGSTGSIGRSGCEVVRHLGPERAQIVALAAKQNIDLLERQAREFSPRFIAVFDEKKALELQKRLPHIPVAAGMEGVKAAAALAEADLVLSAMAGTLGLEPTAAALEAGKELALANKEALVSGGALIMRLAEERGARIIPVDSEHSALFQCLNGGSPKSVSRLLLTASGGPFRTYTEEELAGITVNDALNHPTWNMGPKITIDSSTLMNKGFELIEAHWLFGIPVEQIDVVVHPQSVIHSMAEFVDGSMLAQMSAPSMLVPIQYAVTYPERVPGLLQPFDFIKHSRLDFYEPDGNKFRCLHLAKEAIRAGKSYPCYLNAANEVLVERFLQQQFSWKEIGQKLERLLEKHAPQPVATFDEILAVDSAARADASYFF